MPKDTEAVCHFIDARRVGRASRKEPFRRKPLLEWQIINETDAPKKPNGKLFMKFHVKIGCRKNAKQKNKNRNEHSKTYS